MVQASQEAEEVGLGGAYEGFHVGAALRVALLEDEASRLSVLHTGARAVSNSLEAATWSINLKAQHFGDGVSLACRCIALS